MLRVTESKNAEAAKQYFGKGLVRSDYYIDGQEIPGQWGGKAAERLGLFGQVDQASYFALVDNLHPQTGEQLTPRQKENRRAGYDFTFSAPKTVSVLYEWSQDERILTAFRDSVKETMEEIEREMKTRVRRGGSNENRLTGSMAWAEFVHFTSRPVDGIPDPHLHAHCFALNLTFDEKEQRFKAGQFGELKRDAPYFQAAFDARFAHRLQAMGIPTEKRGLSFEIAGTPQSLIDKNSRRRNEIIGKAAESGIVTPEGKHAIGYYGRENKNKGVGRGELRREWDARLSDEERAALRRAVAGGNGGDGPVTPAQAMDYAVGHSFERASVVSDKRLKAEALRYGVGSVLPSDVAGIAQRDGMIAKEADGQLMTTTKSVLDEEVAMLQFARDGQRKFGALGSGASLTAQLSNEQRKAALQVLLSRDQVVGIRGGAGTGKTTTLLAIKQDIEAAGKLRVYAFAPSAQASRKVLRAEGFNDADTLKALLVNERLQAEVRGQVLLIDEAGLTGTTQMREVFAMAKKQDCRVIAVGDYLQHASVERGDAFRLLEKEAGVRFAELKEIRRQKDPGYRKAVEAVAKGSGKAAQKGFDALDNMGAIVEATGEERHRMLVADYLKAADDGKSALIIAPTHAEGDRLTGELRQVLKERGTLGAEKSFTVRKATGWTEAQKGDARNYQAGMVIEFNKAVAGVRERVAGKRTTSGGFAKGEIAVVKGIENGKVKLTRRDGSEAYLPAANAERFQVYRTRELGVAKGDRIRITKNGEAKAEEQAKGVRINNGDVFTVEGFTKDGDIRLGNGGLLSRNHSHFTLGYVDTSFASQGKTTDRVFISVGSESLPAANRQQWYVSVSRGREAAKVYTDSKENLREAISRGGERLSAVELTQTRIRRNSGAQILKTLTQHHRFARFVKARAEAIADYWKGRQKGAISRA
jgi:conjugative relaxase-like TrwC/TraI family protein